MAAGTWQRGHGSDRVEVIEVMSFWKSCHPVESTCAIMDFVACILRVLKQLLDTPGFGLLLYYPNPTKSN